MIESRNGYGKQELSERDYVLDHRNEIVKGLNPLMEQLNQKFLLDPKLNWQPSDLLPDPRKDDFHEKVQIIREQAKGLSNDLLIVIAGAIITEEALPTYPVMMGRIPAIRDETGEDDTGWAVWTRGWTAEENRHGDVLKTTLYLSGRMNMQAIELSTQYLLRAGFDPGIDNDPIKGLVYVASQEELTDTSHGNSSKIAKEQGHEALYNTLRKIQGDESRHATVYTKVMGKVVEIDPNGALIATRDVFGKRLYIPGKNMSNDGISTNFDKPTEQYGQLTNASIRCGALTPVDFHNITERLVNNWGLLSLTGLSAEGAKAQNELGTILMRTKRLSERFSPKLISTETKQVDVWLNK